MVIGLIRPICFIMASTLSYDSSTEDLNAHDIETG